MEQLAGFMQDYNMRGQHAPDRSMTRYKHDLSKMVENNEISTGPGRWALGVPNHYGNAAFISNPTIRMQRWGASHDMSSTKTDVESDLRNLGRPPTRTPCGQYNPTQQRTLTPMPEADAPMTFGRLVDPPCTLRGSGWNRWEWLCQNPQENALVPFEHQIDSRHAAKDDYYHAMDKPLTQSRAVRERELICGKVFVEPAVPVPRQPGPKDPPTFTDTIPGAPQTQNAGAPPAEREVPRWPKIEKGVKYSGAPPTGPSATPMEEHRRATGILEPPAPFTAYIAPH